MRYELVRITCTLVKEATAAFSKERMRAAHELDGPNFAGTKFGCGVALCGASTIHLDGTAVHSSLPALPVRFSLDHFIRSMS
jgi:aerobic-type carbon monoxide dehydrogenase small subunit (CoxS/CutS family)